jgi:hypothetical protein
MDFVAAAAAIALFEEDNFRQIREARLVYQVRFCHYHHDTSLITETTPIHEHEHEIECLVCQ